MRLTRRRLLGLPAAAALAAGLASSSLETTVLNLGVGRRVLFLADLHVHGPRPDILSAVGGLEYDVVLIGGDMYDEWTPDLDPLIDLLASLRGPKLAVLGNHEYWSSHRHPLRRAIARLEEAGVHVLVDDKVRLGSLTVVGLDWREDPRDYPLVRDADIVVVHSPDAFPRVGSSLVLAGHTHGGQICLPGSISVVTNSVYGYMWGLYTRGDAKMYVSRGLGEMVPVRAFCPRELVLAL